MLNYIWAGMILVGIIFGGFSGNMQAITEAAIESAGEAVSLCIAMAGITSLWVGLMKVAEKAGLITKITACLSPFLSFMFPRIPKGHEALGYISTNIISNILGLGWACTPAGLKAMEALAALEKERGNEQYLKEGGERCASNEMCIFLLLNISSLQLIPINMMAYRSQYGSVSPSSIIAPAIVATSVSTIVAIVYCKCVDVSSRKKSFN